jgi:cytosine/adenosine deaminase-related metal-dependent hydrolase
MIPSLGKASLGVDVCCNIPADMFQQMRLLLQTERHKSNESRPFSEGRQIKVARKCSEVLELATIGALTQSGSVILLVASHLESEQI